MKSTKPFYEVRQSNALTEGRFSLTACQLDIYFYIISLLNEKDEPEKIYEIYVNKIEKLTDRKWDYNQFKESTKGLLAKVIEFNNLNDDFCQTSLISSAKYIKGSGCIQITLSPIIRPLLLELKNRYTSFQLHSAFSMSSKFAKRIYLICSEWKTNKKPGQNIAFSQSYSIKDLRYKLELTDPTGQESDKFKQWGQFKTNVLDTAKKQINTYSDLKIDYKAEKIGRSFDSIQFSISEHNNQQILINFEPEELKEFKDKIIKIEYLVNTLKLNQKQADIIIRRIESSKIREVIDSIGENFKKGTIKNLGAYSVKCFNEKFGLNL